MFGRRPETGDIDLGPIRDAGRRGKFVQKRKAVIGRLGQSRILN